MSNDEVKKVSETMRQEAHPQPLDWRDDEGLWKRYRELGAKSAPLTDEEKHQYSKLDAWFAA